MSKATRRPQQIYTITMWGLSLIFAGFLIGFGSLLIGDLPGVDKSLSQTDFVDQATLDRIDSERDLIDGRQIEQSRAIEDAQAKFRSATEDYASANVSFESWLATRSATKSHAQNPEVLERTRALEKLKVAERVASSEVQAARADHKASERELSDLTREYQETMEAGLPAFEKAQRRQRLLVFMFRLALTLPLLLISGWMILKKRSSSYWPLYRGFVLFSLFAFFVELVPYLPSYGGYVRFGVGIIIIAVAGHFIIKAMISYTARKQAEEARSETERRRSIGYETALKKIAANSCPGCDRTIVTREGVRTDFCAHCGIRLQMECRNCDQLNVSFHPFCLCCGTSNDVGAGQATPPPA